MTNKLSRRGFLTGGTAALAFGGIATGASAQTANGEASLEAYLNITASEIKKYLRNNLVAREMYARTKAYASKLPDPNQRERAHLLIDFMNTVSSRRPNRRNSFTKLENKQKIEVLYCVFQQIEHDSDVLVRITNHYPNNTNIPKHLRVNNATEISRAYSEFAYITRLRKNVPCESAKLRKNLIP